MKTEPVTAGADATVHICLVCVPVKSAQRPNINYSSSRGRLGFYAEIQIFLGQCRSTLSSLCTSQDHRRRRKTDKGRSCCSGDVLECCTKDLELTHFEQKKFLENIHFFLFPLFSMRPRGSCLLPPIQYISNADPDPH